MVNNLKLTFQTFFLVLIMSTVGFGMSGCSGSLDGSLQSDTFEYLEKIRNKKKAAIINRLEYLLKKTDQAEQDSVLTEVFQRLSGTSGRSRADNSFLRETVDKLDSHYALEYGEFYDLLFIQKGGYVFHSIKLESDFRSNLFDGPLEKTKLAHALQQTPVPTFVDYDYYSPSAEPASFLITPVKDGRQTLGWIAFQIPINIVNNIMSDYKGLGITGEAYLTNTSKIMLTQSRLLPEKTIFKLPVDTEATVTAINEGSGNLLIDDYRKIRVFSSFEKFNFQNISWVLIVEMDEDEVITEKFRQNPEYYLEKVYEKINLGDNLVETVVDSNHAGIRVDVNEYAQGKPGERLWTKGVATCTGVAILYPGKFSYLGHLYPLDDTYFTPVERASLKLGQWLQGIDTEAYQANLLGQMFAHITKFDISKTKVRDLKIILVAVHTNSFANIVKQLLDEGVFLSQIKIMHGRQMAYANISVDSEREFARIEWGGKKSGSSFFTSDKGVENLGDLVRSIPIGAS
jgi:hypothetical protein